MLALKYTKICNFFHQFFVRLGSKQVKYSPVRTLKTSPEKLKPKKNFIRGRRRTEGEEDLLS